jgi:hypothetical protein
MNPTHPTRKIACRLLLVALTALVAAPLLSQADAATASDPDAAMDACVQAFVSASLEKQRSYTVETRDAIPLSQLPSTYRIQLTAKGKQSGKQLARATCIVNPSGVVLTLNGKPHAVPAETTAILSAR